MRIDIVGLPGSGKTTLAQAISKKLSIPHIQLDHFWFESGGKQGRFDTPNLEEVRNKVREKVIEASSADSWVSDGAYLHVQDIVASRADVIVFLDIPLMYRLCNHLKRIFEPKKHKKIGIWDEVTFFGEIIKRQKTSKPKLLQFISEYSNKVVILRNRREVNSYIGEL